MSRWIRLNTSFFGDSRTHKLRARIGECALWLVPRLWCFCAEHAQDGRLSEYLPEVLAEELRFSGDGRSLVESLKESGFVDAECQLTDWSAVYGLAKARTESAARAREALAAKRAASSVVGERKQDPSRRQERERTKRDTGTDPVTAAQQPSLSPPQYSDLTTEQRQELWTLFGGETAASGAYSEWRARKLNYGDRFLTHTDAFSAALVELMRTCKSANRPVGAIPEVPGWYGFLRDRSRLLGQDPDSIPATWGALSRDQQEVVLGQRARDALFADGKQGEEAK